ncbi:pheromone A receptor-domain-containing protein [Mycena galopus ATCC 62051]|nr:pheromone A receptor-domain-containing protein [Mycena galopus ATCC 62051]
MLFLALDYIVQGHRFDILEDYGCRPTTYFSIPAIFITWVPPIVIATASLVFAGGGIRLGLALRHFIQRRITFAAHLDANHSALNTSRYMRLMLMSILQMIWSLALTIFTLWFTTVSIPIRVWTTWPDVHSNFSRVAQYPNLFTPQLILSARYALWWTVPASTFLFVAFFAFGNEAMTEYKKAFLWVPSTIFRLPPPASPSTSKAGPGASKFPGGISLASFDAKQSPAPPSPATAKRAEAAYDTQSVASSSVGPALSYHTHPADTDRTDPDFDDFERDDEEIDLDLLPDTPSSYALTATPSTAGYPPGDRALGRTLGFAASPRPRTLTGDSARPYTYPSLEASHHAIADAV